MRAENGTNSTLIGEKNVCLRMLNHYCEKRADSQTASVFCLNDKRQCHRSLGIISTDYDWNQPCKKQWSDNLN